MPDFATEYQRYSKTFSSDPTVYLFRVASAFPPDAIRIYGQAACEAQTFYELNNFRASCKIHKIDLQEFDITTTDFYAIPTLAQTMRVGRYELLDSIMSTPLRTLDEALPHTTGEWVLPRQLVHA